MKRLIKISALCKLVLLIRAFLNQCSIKERPLRSTESPIRTRKLMLKPKVRDRINIVMAATRFKHNGNPRISLSLRMETYST